MNEEKGAFRLESASLYLDLEEGSRWLLEPDCPIPRCDIRKPGSAKPMWRWRKVDLDAFLASRLVQPGGVNPQDQQ